MMHWEGVVTIDDKLHPCRNYRIYEKDNDGSSWRLQEWNDHGFVEGRL